MQVTNTAQSQKGIEQVAISLNAEGEGFTSLLQLLMGAMQMNPTGQQSSLEDEQQTNSKDEKDINELALEMGLVLTPNGIVIINQTNQPTGENLQENQGNELIGMPVSNVVVPNIPQNEHNENKPNDVVFIQAQQPDIIGQQDQTTVQVLNNNKEQNTGNTTNLHDITEVKFNQANDNVPKVTANESSPSGNQSQQNFTSKDQISYGMVSQVEEETNDTEVQNGLTKNQTKDVIINKSNSQAEISVNQAPSLIIKGTEANQQSIVRIEIPAYQVPDKLTEMVKSIMLQQNPGHTTLQMKLQPEHLGEVTVQLSWSKGELSANFITSSGIARDALQSTIPQLKELLAQQNIQLNEAAVFMGQQSSQWEQGSGNGQERWQHRSNLKVKGRYQVASQPVEISLSEQNLNIKQGLNIQV